MFNHIDQGRSGFAARLLDYLRYPSISAQDIGMQDAADRLIQMLTALGLNTTAVPTWLSHDRCPLAGRARQTDGAALRP